MDNETLFRIRGTLAAHTCALSALTLLLKKFDPEGFEVLESRMAILHADIKEALADDTVTAEQFAEEMRLLLWHEDDLAKTSLSVIQGGKD